MTASVPAPPPPPPGFAYAYPAVAASAMPHKLGPRRMLVVAGAVVGVLAVILSAAAVLAKPTVTPPCLTHCAPPGANTSPLPAAHTFTSAGDGWSLDYSDEFAVASSDDHSVAFTVQQCPLEVFTAPGGDADQVIQDALRRFPSSTFANISKVFDLRGAQIGYQAGKGAIYDAQLNPAEGGSRHVRIVVITAARDGVTVVADGYCDDDPNLSMYELASGHGFAFDFPLTNFRWRNQQ